MAVKGTRQDQWHITYILDKRNLGTWDTCSGGEVDSDEQKYKLGGMGETISLGGPVTVGNVTIGRIFDLERDHTELPFIISRVGKGEVTIIKQPLDTDGHVWGKPLVYTGKLKTYTPVESDSNATDPGLHTCEISSAQLIA